MKIRGKSGQRGISFIGLLFVGGIIAVTGVVVAQVVPTVIEWQAVERAVNRARDGNSVAEVRSIFQKSADIDDIKSIAAKDIEVTKQGDKTVVSYAYTREIHLAGPAYLTLKYAGQSK
ncbi:MAG: DUF4845 domain-containing protein [Gammaproteobacteria bacterium]|jgi:hypothetical protein|nr:DUF4845 domain-containing protein [Gammaproteobacteria bacterium]MBU0788575.1 DUF4845 domain-containing protein [Gammaproteobacteria bacterium]MBU0815601.1 DUF4845 domain-containing protein [Gammaproteobacteria bacterium]MBU1788191.1 DUF4845 domain-containing protein [Gammaproteobacteria bacterium]